MRVLRPPPSGPPGGGAGAGFDYLFFAREGAQVFTLALGRHPATGHPIEAGIGRFGPFVVHDKDFRSLAPEDDVYTVTQGYVLETHSRHEDGVLANDCGIAGASTLKRRSARQRGTSSSGETRAVAVRTVTSRC